MCDFQSGMFASRDQPDGLDELVPGLALSRQHTLTCRRQPIEAAPALARLLDPRPLDPAALFEAIEQRIERVEVEHQPPARLRLDELAEFIAVPGSGYQHRQEEQFGGALFQFAVERREVDVCHKQILAYQTKARPCWLASVFGEREDERQRVWPDQSRPQHSGRDGPSTEIEMSPGGEETQFVPEGPLRNGSPRSQALCGTLKPREKN